MENELDLTRWEDDGGAVECEHADECALLTEESFNRRHGQEQAPRDLG